MNLSNLRVNQLSPEAWGWYQSYLTAIDLQDVARYASFLSPVATLQFNNDAPIVGRDAIVQMLTGYWKSFEAVKHEPLNIYGSDHRFVLEALNHYRRHDGKPVSVRAVAFTDRGSDGLAVSARIYADVSQLFVP